MISIRHRLPLPLLMLLTIMACRTSDQPVNPNPSTPLATIPLQNQKPISTDPGRCTVESPDIQEAVLRYMMLTQVGLPADSYYLQIEKKDPSRDFLNRFLKTGIKVYAASARPTGGLGAPPTDGHGYKMDAPLGM